MEDKKERVWKCRHCIFLKKDSNHGNKRVCFLGGKITWMDANNVACSHFVVTNRAKAVGKYLDRRDAGLVGNKTQKWKPDKKVSAKEMLKRLEKHLVAPGKRKTEEMAIKKIGYTPIPSDERTSAFNEQQCAGRCCKRKEVCKHYVSWLEHGRPMNSVFRMISSVNGCINDVGSGGSALRFSHFLPLDGMSVDDVKEYTDTANY